MRFLLITALLIGSVLPANAQPRVSVTFDTFHVALASHGVWLTVGAYGRVWRPRGVAANWRPYYRGKWVWTDDGWLWDSDEPWGWATYHYGRWAYEPAYGWIWVPGYKWAPSWVEWRSGDEDIGWAPLPPQVHITIVPKKFWVFVPYKRFAGAPVHQVAYHRRHSPRYWKRTHPLRVHAASAVRHGGPHRRYVERRMGRRVKAVRTVEVDSPRKFYRRHKRRNEVRVFRPHARRHDSYPRRKVVRPSHRAPVPHHRALTPHQRPAPHRKALTPHQRPAPHHRSPQLNRNRVHKQLINPNKRSRQLRHKVLPRDKKRRIEERDQVHRAHEVKPVRH